MPGAEFKYEIVKELAVLSTNEKTGWQKVIALVSFNDKPARLDIREWSSDRKKMGKGVAFFPSEVSKLKEVLANYDENASVSAGGNSGGNADGNATGNDSENGSSENNNDGGGFSSSDDALPF